MQIQTKRQILFQAQERKRKEAIPAIPTWLEGVYTGVGAAEGNLFSLTNWNADIL